MRLQRPAALALLFRKKARSARLPRASRCGELRNSRNYATGIIAPLLSWLPARCLPSGARLRPLVNALATTRYRYHFFAVTAPICSFFQRLKDANQKYHLIFQFKCTSRPQFYSCLHTQTNRMRSVKPQRLLRL